MLLTVIVPTCNRKELLRICLNLLSPKQQSINASDYEVIITDDSQNNETKDVIEQEFPWATWVEGPRKGPAANRNNGVRYAKGDWLIFIDDDCLPDINILHVYKNALINHENTQVFEGSIKVDRKQQSLLEESPINETGGYLWSCNFMINKNLFLQTMGGFDEQFPYASMEDVDLHYRLQKLHIQCLFLPEATVIHPWRIQKKLISITLKRYKSTLYFLRKHPEKSKEINSVYYLRAFYRSLVRQTLMKSFSYRFNGFFPKIMNDMLILYLAAHVFFYRKK